MIKGTALGFSEVVAAIWKINDITHLRLTYDRNYVHFLNVKTDGGFVAFGLSIFLII
jgi:hypothetical protein